MRQNQLLSAHIAGVKIMFIYEHRFVSLPFNI